MKFVIRISSEECTELIKESGAKSYADIKNSDLCKEMMTNELF